NKLIYFFLERWIFLSILIPMQKLPAGVFSIFVLLNNDEKDIHLHFRPAPQSQSICYLITWQLKE
ncbi:hypothetical protein CUS29_14205, partial [Enterococcus faecium]